MTRFKHHLRWILPMVMMFLACGLLYRVMQGGAKLSWRTFNWVSLCAAAAAAVVQELTNPLLAKYCLRTVRQEGSYLRLLSIVTATATSNAIIPLPAGIPIRLWFQKRSMGITYRMSSLAVIIESALGYGILVVAASISLLCWSPEIVESMNIVPGTVTTIAVVSAVVLGFILTWVIFRHYRHKLDELLSISQTVHISTSALCIAAVITIVGIALAYIRLVSIGDAVGARAIQWGVVFTGLVISRFAGVVSMVPMGLGARDLSLAYFLVLAGAHPLIAAAWAAVDRIVMTLPYLIIGLFSIPAMRRLRLES